jgi:hypothetical protein
MMPNWNLVSTIVVALIVFCFLRGIGRAILAVLMNKAED